MKNNKNVKVMCGLLVLVLLTTCVIGTTLARYTTSDSASDTARVAHWGVRIEVDGDSNFSNQYSNVTNGVTVKSYDAANVVAPGTSSTESSVARFAISGTPEVAVNINVLFENVQDVVLKAGTYYNECTADTGDTFTLDEDYYPVRFTLTQTSSATGVLGAPITGTLAEIKAWVDANYNTTANYDPNTDLAATFELSWEWVYEGGNDLADTVLGNLAAGTSENSAKVAGTDYNLTIHYDLTVTATQIN